MRHNTYVIGEGVIKRQALGAKLAAAATAALFAVALSISLTASAATSTVVVTGDTAAGVNQPGWLFNRDLSTSTPYEFNYDAASVGVGSLYVDKDKTIQLVDTPEFPDIFKPTAKGQGRNLLELQASKGITWTFISPSAYFDSEGPRTGSYQKGKDHLLVNSKGKSYVSYSDYAKAVVDEIEHPQHINERFTVVSESK